VANAAGLKEAELDRLAEFLRGCKGAMNIEEVDGFFAALIAGPEVVAPSEYLPHVFVGIPAKLNAHSEGKPNGIPG
jgi:yecA family protein